MNKISFRFLTGYTAIICYLIIIKILIHLLNPEYGYHRDELFYIAISDNFSFKNLDVLPLTPLYLKLITTLLGYSIKAIHFASALCGALSILFTCLIARELGGKKYAVFMAGLCVLFSGFLAFGAIFTYDSLDFLFWVACIYIMVRIFKEDNPRLWIIAGLIIGLGLMNKLTIIFLGLMIFVVLWLVPQRRFFANKWIWIAGLTAFLFTIPFLIWQHLNNWYFMDFARTYAGGISYVPSFLEYLVNQILPNNPTNLFIWLTGLALLVFSRKWKQYRFFGLGFVFLFFLFFFLGVKFYFLIPFYTILIAVGCIQIEVWINRLKIRARTVLMIVLPVIYILLSLPSIPMIMPVLPVESFVNITQKIGMAPDAGTKLENLETTVLPQHFADRFGWEEMVREIARVYHSLPEEEKADAGIVTNNWGQASAVHFYREKYNLPEPISPHGWYYFHTLRTHRFRNVYVSTGIDQQRLEDIFGQVVKSGLFSHPYCMPYENNKPVYICRNPKYNLEEYWTTVRY
jgi:hypothetical protein